VFASSELQGGQAAHQRRGAADRGEYCQAAGAGAEALKLKQQCPGQSRNRKSLDEALCRNTLMGRCGPPLCCRLDSSKKRRAQPGASGGILSEASLFQPPNAVLPLSASHMDSVVKDNVEKSGQIAEHRLKGDRNAYEEI
jgi:hypothetical protein